MTSRYLILFSAFVLNSLTSYTQFNSPVNPKDISVNPDLIIQVGAFRLEPNSSVLKGKLLAVLDYPVTVVIENGFYKVQITGFTSQEEMEKLYPTLAFLGLKNFWVLPVRKREEINVEAIMLPDTPGETIVRNPDTPVIADDPPIDSIPSIALQIEVYRDKSEAIDAQRIIKTKLNLPVQIVQEWEYYKVFVTGFKTVEEANKYYPDLAKLGFPKISLIEHFKQRK
ncbi:MAG TPA: hypothetical protein DEO60_01245 [Bacteroidales bacterium]|jgi:hypothetical protein|nr:hypothetical protein [Bacteroidales bacterium]HBZ19727.1 hypothetical protein [Bacteroidales bacterium]